jgi:hypothetical protein
MSKSCRDLLEVETDKVNVEIEAPDDRVEGNKDAPGRFRQFQRDGCGDRKSGLSFPRPAFSMERCNSKRYPRPVDCFPTRGARNSHTTAPSTTACATRTAFHFLMAYHGMVSAMKKCGQAGEA